MTLDLSIEVQNLERYNYNDKYWDSPMKNYIERNSNRFLLNCMVQSKKINKFNVTESGLHYEFVITFNLEVIMALNTTQCNTFGKNRF